MGAGLPGMGIASLFYVAAALIAPIPELVRTVRGRSSLDRWREVMHQFLMALAITVAVVALYVGIHMLVVAGVVEGTAGPVPLRRVPNFVYAFAALVGVLVVTTSWATWAAMKGQDESPARIAAAHRAGVASTRDLTIDLTAKPSPKITTSPPPVAERIAS